MLLVTESSTKAHNGDNADLIRSDNVQNPDAFFFLTPRAVASNILDGRVDVQQPQSAEHRSRHYGRV